MVVKKKLTIFCFKKSVAGKPTTSFSKKILDYLFIYGECISWVDLYCPVWLTKKKTKKWIYVFRTTMSQPIKSHPEIVFFFLIEENSISRIKVPHYCPVPSSSRWHSYKICIHTGNLGRKWVPVSLPQMTCWEIENHGETVLVCFSYCS